MPFNFDGKKIWSGSRTAIGRIDGTTWKTLAGSPIARIERDRVTTPAGDVMFLLRERPEMESIDVTDLQGNMLKRIRSDGRIYDRLGNVEGFIE